MSSVLLITGARQTGKSTLLRHMLGDKVPVVVFDPVLDIGNARSNPDFFLDQFPTPVIFDEIQFAPELLSSIKRRVDRDDRPGQYFLTGSQNLALLKQVSESLAGRVLILDLEPMTLAERCGAGLPATCWLDDILDDADDAFGKLSSRKRLPVREIEKNATERIWRGGFPRLLDMANDSVGDVLMSYFRTYIERDVRQMTEVSDLQLFGRFVSLCAALTAQEINHSELGRELGVTPQTAQRWINVLKAAYQWMELPPYHGNTIKRISRRPKGYFVDTGLAVQLLQITAPTALAGHPSLGALFETMAVQEITRRARASGKPTAFHYWRSHGGAEVDLLIERNGWFVAVEIKSTANPRPADTRGIKAFRETYPALRHGPGIVLAAVEAVQRLTEDIWAVPYDLA